MGPPAGQQGGQFVLQYVVDVMNFDAAADPSDCSDCVRSLQTVVGWSDMCVALLMPSIGGLRLYGCCVRVAKAAAVHLLGSAEAVEQKREACAVMVQLHGR